MSVLIDENAELLPPKRVDRLKVARVRHTVFTLGTAVNVVKFLRKVVTAPRRQTHKETALIDSSKKVLAFALGGSSDVIGALAMALAMGDAGHVAASAVIVQPGRTPNDEFFESRGGPRLGRRRSRCSSAIGSTRSTRATRRGWRRWRRARSTCRSDDG